MNASRRAARSWVRAECSNAMASSCARCLVGMLLPVRQSAPAEDLLDLLPTTLRHVPGRASRLDSVRAGRDAVERASHDALGDAGGAEHVVRDIKVPLIGIDRPAFDAAAVRGDVVEFRGYPERGQVEPAHAAERAAGNAPAHAMVGEVGERMAARGELP